MDFTNEAYVRLYTRNTATWAQLGFEGQAVFALTERHMDRSGVFTLGGMTPVEALVLIARIPEEVARKGLAILFKLGVFVPGNDALVDPTFVEAQEASKTNKQRQRDFRERRRTEALETAQLNFDEPERINPNPVTDVTPGLSKAEQSSLSSSEISLLNSESSSLPKTTSRAANAVEVAPTKPPTVLTVVPRTLTARGGGGRSKANRMAHGPGVTAPALRGFTWFASLKANGDTTRIPPIAAFQQAYEYIGTHCPTQGADVAKHIWETQWCLDHRIEVTPVHCMRYWLQYAEGPRNKKTAVTFSPARRTGPAPVSSHEEFAEDARRQAAGESLF